MSQYIENCSELTELSGGAIDEGAALAIGSFFAEAEGLFNRIMRSQVLTVSQRASVAASIPSMFIDKLMSIKPLRDLAKLAVLKCAESVTKEA